MDFLKFKKIYEEQGGYSAEVFEDEMEQNEINTQANQAAAREAAGYKNQIEVLLSKYFAKAGDDALTAIDGFAADLKDALSDFLQDKWLKKDYFTGNDNAYNNFRNNARQLLDVKNLPKLQDFLHSLGQAVQSLKINAK